jgi:hypothetical protein
MSGKTALKSNILFGPVYKDHAIVLPGYGEWSRLDWTRWKMAEEKLYNINHSLNTLIIKPPGGNPE